MRLIGKLVAETDAAGRLQMWGNGPGRPSARLRFTPGALMLEAPGCESVALDWADCLNFDEPRLAPPSGMWKIDFWAMTRKGSVGVGIRMIGS